MKYNRSFGINWLHKSAEYESRGVPKGREFSETEAKEIGEKLGINWDEVDINEFKMGLQVETEHGTVIEQTNVTDDDPVKTGKIALVHLYELPDYYTRLEKMEKEAKK